MAVVSPGLVNAAGADGPPPPDPPADGVAITSGAKKLGPADELELLMPVNAPGVLLLNPPEVLPEALALAVLPPDGINPRTTNGFNAAVAF
jgi:hypothetical protein